MQSIELGISGFSYNDLYEPARLAALHEIFNQGVKDRDPGLFEQFQAYQACQGEGMSAQAISELLVRYGPHVGEFVARLFDVESERTAQMTDIREQMETVFVYRKEIVAKLRAKFKAEDATVWDVAALGRDLDLLMRSGFAHLIEGHDREKTIATVAESLLRLDKHYKQATKGKSDDRGHCETADADTQRLRELIRKDRAAKQRFSSLLSVQESGEFVSGLLEVVQRWSFAAQHHPELADQVKDWVSFKTPEKTDFSHLVEHETLNREGYDYWMGPPSRRRRRDGFGLTDKRFNQRETLYEVDHCIYCHERDTDSCAKGMRNKKAGGYKTNPLGVTVTGCPLDEKISEMHWVKRQGDNIGALALVMIDNPMCPGTGHRICNDCMKACIYQKTEPVNIPQIETNVLTDVLFMRWGFEIYHLLTRWNPLNIKRPYALPYNGKKILVVGLGPAGYTLSHYLLNEGFGVVAIDGLKIEPLDQELVGDGQSPPAPIEDFNTLYEALDKRIMLGFGGVAEYGITVRWDKNFLKVIYLTLARHKAFRCYGGIRFGGTLTINDVWDLGFDHIAIASGAGKPTIIGLKNNLIRGIRKASDFLMALQLTGAAKQSSLANLQVRLPAGVIGGGLTAIDTTTELLAYYPVQVEKILHRYERLSNKIGADTIHALYDEEEQTILSEFLGHGRAIRAERKRAEAAGEVPNFQPLVEKWGGVTLFYRKGIKDAPAYRQNHEEIKEALDEGIALAEGMSPLEAFADQFGHLASVAFDKLVPVEEKWTSQQNVRKVPMRSLFVAAGTSPNIIYENEYPDTFEMDGKFYQRYKIDKGTDGIRLVAEHDDGPLKIAHPAPFTSYQKNGRYISFYGDNHPVYAGNVVKAMASAKHGYPYVVELFEDDIDALDTHPHSKQQQAREQALAAFHKELDSELLATVVEVNRLTPTIVEVIVKAPMPARKFRPGQFYRVQNLEAHAPVVEGTALAAEGLALTGAWVDKERGLISLIALEMGSSSRLCALWQAEDPVIIMGVTGAPTEIPTGKSIMLLGGGLGNAVLFSIGKALRAAGNRVIYFAGYKNATDMFKVEDIEEASDVIVWSVDPGPDVQPIATTRPQDKSIVGNIVEAMVTYAKGELGDTPIHLDDVEHMIVIGSDRMMAAVKAARFKQLAPYLNKHHVAIGSINSPMQCMMKGVCAQCLCKHLDPETGEEYFVYSCYNQDQDLDHVDFPNLNARLRQNSVQEKLSNLWLDYLLRQSPEANLVKQSE